MWWGQVKVGLSVIVLSCALSIPLVVFAYLMVMVVSSNLYPIVQAVLLPVIVFVAVSVFALFFTIYDMMS
jgi:hypothetical protein